MNLRGLVITPLCYNPDMLETLFVVVIVAAAIAYLTSVFVRAARGQGGCGGGCGCASAKTSEPNLGKRYDLISLGTKPPHAPK